MKLANIPRWHLGNFPVRHLNRMERSVIMEMSVHQSIVRKRDAKGREFPKVTSKHT
jgi:hypothetical protein